MAQRYDPMLQHGYSQAQYNAYHMNDAATYVPYEQVHGPNPYPPPLPTPETSQSSPTPAPSNRLAGEPAFCAGRHCCQWAVGGLVCNNHYPSAEELDKHVASDHAGKHPGGQPSGDYHCYWAGCSKTESFGNKPKLTRHVHSHTGHKPHKCTFPGCGKGFVTKEQLKNHETTHTRTKEHICPECGKGFAVKTALTSHMNVHKGAKPYICDECGKGFADSSNLSKHKAIHKRAALKKAHHKRHSSTCHVLHMHSRTSSHASTPMMTPTIAATPAPYCYVHAHPHAHAHPHPYPHQPYTQPQEFPATTSIEPYCGLPCFDAHCPDAARMPCRSASPCKSAPCSDQNCNATECPEPGCHIEPCLESCAEPCGVTDCHQDACNLDHCDFDGCQLLDCHGHEGCNVPEDWCADHDNFDCFCMDGAPSDVETLATPSTTRESVPCRSNQGTRSFAGPGSYAGEGKSQDPFDFDLRPAAVTSQSSGSGNGQDTLPDGFKRLSEFINYNCGEFCGCAEGGGRAA